MTENRNNGGPAAEADRHIEDKARTLCFADCSAGRHLDFEAGCCSRCRASSECQSWRSYTADAREALATRSSSKEA